MRGLRRSSPSPRPRGRSWPTSQGRAPTWRSAGCAVRAGVPTPKRRERRPPRRATPAKREQYFWIPTSGSGAGGGSLRIVNLEDGARFAIDPDRPRELQRLGIEVVAPENAGRVRLGGDGQSVGDLGPPYAFDWPLVQGDHVIVAQTDGIPPSAPLRVHVRGICG